MVVIGRLSHNARTYYFSVDGYTGLCSAIRKKYRHTSDIWRTLVGNNIVDL